MYKSNNKKIGGGVNAHVLDLCLNKDRAALGFMEIRQWAQVLAFFPSNML